MADVKISALPASTTPLAGTEVLPIVQSGVTKQVSVDNLTAGKAVSVGSLTSDGNVGVGGSLTTTANASGLITIGRYSAGYPWSLIRPSTDSSGFEFRSFAGTQWLNIDTSGNLGIGTSSPAGRLDVTATNAGGTTYNYFQNNGASGVSSVGLAFAQSGSIKSSIVSAVYGNDYMAFNVGSNTERMRLDASGNLGLGVTPSAWGGGYKAIQFPSGIYGGGSFITDSGSPAITANAYNNGGWKYVNNDYATIYQSRSGQHQWYTAPSGTANNPISFTQAMTLDASGNLGLGVTPSAWGGAYTGAFQLKNNGALVNNQANDLHLCNNTYFNSTNWIYSSSNGASRFEQFNGGHYWFTAPSGTAGDPISFTQAMTLDASGNLLVGTTTVGYSSQSGFTFSPASSSYYTVAHANGSGSGDGYAYFAYNGSLIGSITQNGTTGVLYNIISDYRLKTFVAQVSGSGERIDALNPVEFEWKADGRRARGFFAHEFQSVYADSVAGEKDAVDEEGKPVYQQMQASTNEVIADLVAELKSLRARVAQLEGK